MISRVFTCVLRPQLLCLALRERSLSSLWHSGQTLADVFSSDELRRLVEEARTRRTPKQKSPGNTLRTSRALGDGSGSWRCCKCAVEKTLAHFSVREGGYVRSYCKTCDNQRRADYERTLRGNASALVRNAKKRSRMKGWDCNLDIDFILDTILRQEGRCAYSGVQMQLLLPHSDWRMSLERIDNAIGYVPENSVLIAAEFNTMEKISKKVPMQATSGSSKWSLQKVQGVRAQRLRNVDLQILDESIQAARARRGPFAVPSSIASFEGEVAGILGHFRCSRCGVWKPANCFSLGKTSRRGLQDKCKQCASEYQIAHRMTLRGHIQRMLGHARGRHKLGKWHGNFEIDLDSVLKMLWSQQGRCFYSDVPLHFAQLNVDWMMSLERLDNSRSYTKDNTVLVALEFNTPDHSQTAKSEVFGSSQWSRWKVEHVWGRLGESSE